MVKNACRRCQEVGVCIGAFQSAEWALVKGLTGNDVVVDQALNDYQSRQRSNPHLLASPAGILYHCAT